MPKENDERLILTVLEAAKLLGLSRGLAYEAVRMKQIPSVRIGRRILVPRAALLRLLDSGLPHWPLDSGPSGLNHEEPRDHPESRHDSKGEQWTHILNRNR